MRNKPKEFGRKTRIKTMRRLRELYSIKRKNKKRFLGIISNKFSSIKIKEIERTIGNVYSINTKIALLQKEKNKTAFSLMKLLTDIVERNVVLFCPKKDMLLDYYQDGELALIRAVCKFEYYMPENFIVTIDDYIKKELQNKNK